VNRGKKYPPTPRDGLLNIPIYMRGLAAVDGIDKVIKLSSNENPLGCSPLAARAAVDAAQNMHRYPEIDDGILRHAIADYFSLDPGLIYCGAGSDQILSLLVQAYASTGDEVIFSENGYPKFKVYAMTAGATPVAVRDDTFRVNVDNILSGITVKTRLIMLANPDNPSGTYLPRPEILRLYSEIPKDVILVLDSAYAEYAFAEDYDVCSDLVEQNNNVVMSRTFSKIFGMASARLGWLYAPEATVDVLRRTELSFPVTGSSLAAGLAALKDRDFVEHSREHNAYWRSWCVKKLAAFDVRFDPGQTNFLLLQFDQSVKSAKAANEYLLSQGIIGRMLGTAAMQNCLRISIGLEDEMRTFVNQLEVFFDK
jgi:histidinol-phosphate aminotransferase